MTLKMGKQQRTLMKQWWFFKKKSQPESKVLEKLKRLTMQKVLIVALGMKCRTLLHTETEY